LFLRAIALSIPDRCNGLLGANMRDLSHWSSRNCVEKFLKQRQQVLDAVALAEIQDDRDGKVSQVLLEGKVLIDRNEDVELSLSHRKELAVGDA
jgi:hypothetical protein